MTTILLIDDNKFYRLLLHDLLCMNNYEVLIAESEFAGIQLAESAQPDIVLCNIDMPGLNQPPVSESLQRMIMMDEIPVVLLSNQYGQASSYHAVQPGIRNYISKLTDPDNLLALVSDLVKQNNQQPVM